MQSFSTDRLCTILSGVAHSEYTILAPLSHIQSYAVIHITPPPPLPYPIIPSSNFPQLAHIQSQDDLGASRTTTDFGLFFTNPVCQIDNHS
jgi:hypothetical protein